MKLSAFKKHLKTAKAVNFVEPYGMAVPRHFHITEAGLSTKHFIDCGGTIRTEKHINFQVWAAEDINHRLEPQKLLKIIKSSEKLFGDEDLEVEIEYQSETIGKYGLDIDGENFVLTTKHTNCLAKDNCGIPQGKHKISVTELSTQTACCEPGGGCC